MQHPKLAANIRETLGKKVKQLRKDGKMPANVYGKNISSRAIDVAYIEFLPLYKEVGETGIIDLTVDGKAVPVLIKNPQIDFRTHQPIHVDFFQVNLKEKLKANIAIKLVGDPKPVTEKQGLLLQTLNEVEIEALPEDLPEFLEADASTLEEIGDMLEVSDLKVPDGVMILTDPEQAIAQVSELVVEEKEPEPVAPAEGEEGAVEGETSAEGEATEGSEGASAENPAEEEKK